MNMKAVCRRTFNGEPELDQSRTIWSFIAAADRISCVLDGDAVQVSAIYRGEEVPLAEVGRGAWRKRGVLAEVLAGYATHGGDSYRSRLKVFAQKDIDWIGD
jgi:hypothetical protein